jgi:glyoxylate reductase
MRVLVTRRIPAAGLELLQAAGLELDVYEGDGAIPRPEMLRRSRGVEAILSLLTDRVDAAVMDAAPGLRVVSNLAVGHDNVDVAEARRRGIRVCNTPDVLTEATADLTWALLMAAARRLVEGDRMVREGRFRIWDPQLLLGHSVAGRTLGVVGMGRIGRAVAERATGFRMEVLYLERPTVPTPPTGAAWRAVPTLEALLAEADFVSLHVPMRADTRHLVDEARIHLMKPSAYLINTARGPLVDEAALARALRERRIAGAALDVFEEEPSVHPDLVGLDNVVLAPHIGSATLEARNAMARLAALNLLAVLEGRSPLHEVTGREPF